MSSPVHKAWFDKPLHVATPAGTSVADVLVATNLGMRDGDLLYYDDVNSVCKPASSFAWDTSLALTQAQFAALFAGVMRGTVTKTDIAGTRLRIWGGLFSLPVPVAATFSRGDLVGVAQQTSSGSPVNALRRDGVVKVDSPSKAIGVVMKDYTSNTTEVLCQVFPHRVGDPVLQERVHEISLPAGDPASDNGDVATWTPGRAVALMTAQYIAMTAESTAASLIGFKKNSTALNDGAGTPTAITINVDNGTAVGAVIELSAQFRPGETVHRLAPGDVLHVTRGNAGASTGLVVIRYFDL